MQIASMKITFFFLFLLAVYSVCFGQIEEPKTNSDTSFYHDKSIMIIPFEHKMYRSQIDKDLAKENNITFDNIVSKFRNGVSNQFRFEMLYRYKAFSILNIHNDSLRIDLDKIYSGISYDYEVILDTAGYSEANPLERIKMDKQIKEAQKEPFNGTKNGEIVSTRDTRKKYMKTVVKDTSLLSYLDAKYHCDYFLFINELDLMNDLSNINSVSTGEWTRAIKIHFTVLNRDGTIVETGLLEKSFDKNENNIQSIINKEIKVLATSLRHKMGQHELRQQMLIKEQEEKSMNELNPNPIKKGIISAKKRLKKN